MPLNTRTSNFQFTMSLMKTTDNDIVPVKVDILGLLFTNNLRSFCHALADLEDAVFLEIRQNPEPLMWWTEAKVTFIFDMFPCLVRILSHTAKQEPSPAFV